MLEPRDGGGGAPCAVESARRQEVLSFSRTVAGGVGYTSLVIAMIIPITTNTTIATCIQIHVGDMH